jgi:hypothetical protein
VHLQLAIPDTLSGIPDMPTGDHQNRGMKITFSPKEIRDPLFHINQILSV